MAERSLRGMSIGAKSLESDEHVELAARTEVAYVCPKGHRTILPLAEGAEIPDEWECRCGEMAHIEGKNPNDEEHTVANVRSHWDMLVERRDEDELKELLDKRLKMHREGWFPDYE
ncbi:electron transporter [Bifidobacterium aemilianum]|uniref:RNA polymerase-binding protein RbpA n=1 Tax=Bifidobacterium aemilianum TaxID=2493120 RepID=A0A366K8P3_9BIFI|nr:RNA polymerase-binding protein RbpA [Bifidobacterium aemilianum]RBP98039.1 electron transporter [Bifidobacterium aemilianum]